MARTLMSTKPSCSLIAKISRTVHDAVLHVLGVYVGIQTLKVNGLHKGGLSRRSRGRGTGVQLIPSLQQRHNCSTVFQNPAAMCPLGFHSGALHYRGKQSVNLRKQCIEQPVEPHRGDLYRTACRARYVSTAWQGLVHLRSGSVEWYILRFSINGYCKT